MKREDVLVILFPRGFIITNEKNEMIFDGTTEKTYTENLEIYTTCKLTDSILKGGYNKTLTESFNKWVKENIKD